MSRRYDRLTRDNVKKLSAGQRITEGGITAEALVDGSIRWSVNVMVSARRVHRVIGRSTDGVTRTDCETFIERVKSEERAERLHLPSGRKTWLTFRQLAERYLDRMETTGGKNLKAKRVHVHQRLVPYFKDQRADTLSTFTVDGYKKKRQDAGAASGTVNRELATLRHLFRDAVRAKDLKAVPCTFSLLKEPAGRNVVLTDTECDSLLAAAVADQNPDAWLFVAFATNTPMRHSEIVRARFDQIDWSRRLLRIPKAKAGERDQPLTPALVAMLQRERDQRDDRDGYIFAAPRARTRTEGHLIVMRKPFRRSVIRAGLDPQRVTPHVLRHTAITKLVQAGVDLPTIQRISGHKTLAMVLRYTHVSGAHVDAAMRALDRTLPEPEAADENASATQVSHELHMPPNQRVVSLAGRGRKG